MSTIDQKPAPSHTAIRQSARYTRISCILLTYNEEKNIGHAVQSLQWIDDIIVVDSHSTDRTLEVVKEARPDTRIFSNPFRDFGQQRNWALENCSPKHEWILFLDADERSTPAFEEAVKQTLSNEDGCVGYFLTYRNMFLGRWLKRSTFYPSWQLRILKLGEVTYQAEGHGQREVTKGNLGRIDVPYDHFPFEKGLESWIEKHNRYSTSECDLIDRLRVEPLKLMELLNMDPLVRRRCLKRMASRIGFRPTIRFVYTYIFRGGFLDGLPGYIYCRLMSQYEFQLWAKIQERRLTRNNERLSERQSQ